MPPTLRSRSTKRAPDEKGASCPTKCARTDGSHLSGSRSTKRAPDEKGAPCPTKCATTDGSNLSGSNQQGEQPTAAARATTSTQEETIPRDIFCPITMRIMEDPVVAEDGRFYERGAIEEHIMKAKQNRNPLRSPMTNAAMGPALLPAYPVKGLIEELMVTRKISGPEVDEWKKRQEEMPEFNMLKKRAEKGDGEACRRVAMGYMKGRPVPRNIPESQIWYAKGADALDPVCIVECQMMKNAGRAMAQSVRECSSTEVSLLSYAAAAGSDFACLILGNLYYQGITVKEDRALAASFLCKGLVGPHKYKMRRSLCVDYDDYRRQCINTLKKLKGTLTIDLET